MSNPDPNSQVEAWLRQGIDAARTGDHAAAQALLERVVTHDQRNERGWFWLAAVVDNVEQKRICLGNVLTINPHNERARNLLAKLQAIAGGQPVETGAPATPIKTTSTEATATGAPANAEPPVEIAGTTSQPVQPTPSRTADDGNDRRIWYVAAIVGTVATVVLLVVLVMMLSGRDDNGDDSGNEVPPATVASFNQPTADNDDTAVSTGEPAGPTPPPAEITATPPSPPTLPPPTWTLIPSNTPIPDVPPTVFPPAPVPIGGKIIMRSGQVPGDPQNQPIAIINPDGTNQQTITDDQRGHAPALSPDGNRMVYIKYSPGTREVLMQFDNLQGTAPQFGTDYWGRIATLINPNHPDWSPDGRWLAFTAAGMGSVTADLYLLDMADTPTGDILQRLTEDEGIEAWPSFAPDGTQIVYEVDRSALEFGAGTDLRVYNVLDGSVRDLTTNGPELIESAPDWSPNGTQIVFAAQESGGLEKDIYLIDALGETAPQKIIDSNSDDIQPRFSPDGRYIVFSSERSGNWDVFIYDLTTQSYYQVTTARHTDIANDWEH